MHNLGWLREQPPLFKDFNRLIFAASSDKNVEGVLRRLAEPEWNEIWLVPYTGSRSMKNEALQQLVREVFPEGTEYRLFGSPEEVIRALGSDEGRTAKGSTFTLATGSLYLVGELLKYLKASDEAGV